MNRGGGIVRVFSATRVHTEKGWFIVLGVACCG